MTEPRPRARRRNPRALARGGQEQRAARGPRAAGGAGAKSSGRRGPLRECVASKRPPHRGDQVGRANVLALSNSSVTTGSSPTTQASWPGSMTYASPGPTSTLVPSPWTTWSRPLTIAPTCRTEVADALIETVVATASLRDAGRTLARLRRLGLMVEEREAGGDRIVRIQQPG